MFFFFCTRLCNWAQKLVENFIFLIFLRLRYCDRCLIFVYIEKQYSFPRNLKTADHTRKPLLPTAFSRQRIFRETGNRGSNPDPADEGDGRLQRV